MFVSALNLLVSKITQKLLKNFPQIQWEVTHLGHGWNH